MGGYQQGEGENGGKGMETTKQNWQVQNRQREVKNSTGNGEAQELLCTTHEHEIRQGVGRGMLVGGGVQGRGE